MRAGTTPGGRRGVLADGCVLAGTVCNDEATSPTAFVVLKARDGADLLTEGTLFNRFVRV